MVEIARNTCRFAHKYPDPADGSPPSQGLARLARAEKAYEASLRKTFGGCLASNKLKGFASEGREVPETSSPASDDVGGARGPSTQADGDEDEPWSEGSDSETASGDESSCSGSSSDDDEEKQEERVDALYKVATSDGGTPAINEESKAGTDDSTVVQPEEEAIEGKAVPAAATEEASGEGKAGAAPCSEPGTDEVVPISSLSALAKEFAVPEKPSKEQEAGVAADDDGYSKAVDTSGQENEAAAPAVVPP